MSKTCFAPLTLTYGKAEISFFFSSAGKHVVAFDSRLVLAFDRFCDTLLNSNIIKSKSNQKLFVIAIADKINISYKSDMASSLD